MSDLLTPIPPSKSPIKLPPTEGIAPIVALTVKAAAAIDEAELRGIVAKWTGSGIVDQNVDAEWMQAARRLLLVSATEEVLPFPVLWFSCGAEYWVAVQVLPPQGAMIYMGCTPGDAGEVPAITVVANLSQDLAQGIMKEYRRSQRGRWNCPPSMRWSGELLLNRASCAVQMTPVSAKDLLFDRSVREYIVTIVGAGGLLTMRTLDGTASATTLSEFGAAALQGFGSAFAVVVVWMAVRYFFTVRGARRLAWRTVGWDAE